MLSLGKYVYEHFFRTVQKEEVERQFDETFEWAQTLEEEYNKEHCIEIETDDIIDDPNEKCTQRNGKITSLNNEGGMINGELPFNMHMAPSLHLSLGQTVCYLSYRNADGQNKVRRIIEIVEENWACEPVTEELIEEVRQQRPEVFATLTVTKMGYIVSKRKEFVEVDVDDERLHFSLDEVESTFKPRVNDRIALFCEVQRDPKLITEAGPTMEIRKIEPPINKNIVGKITSVEQKSHGIIDGKYFFYWDAVDQDYRVVGVDDRVTADIIECELDDITWRCLKVVLVEKAPENFPNDSFLRGKQSIDNVNEYGIQITDEIVVDLNDRDDTKEFTMIVKNVSDKEQKVLENVFIGNKSESQLELLSPGRNASFFLQPGEEKSYVFKATGRYYGEATEKFYIKFSGRDRPFKIMRYIKICVHDTEQAHNTIGTGSNLHKNRAYSQKVFSRDLTGKIPGVPIKRTANFVAFKFEHYHVPRSLKVLVLSSFSTGYINETLDSIFPYLRENLYATNYNLVFHTLLHLEECEMVHSMRKYDKTAYFKRERDFLALTVENIAESRPSIVLGDYVIATSPFETTNAEEVSYEGVIHEVKRDRVLLKFAENFQSRYNNEDYKLTFHFSRMPLKKEHHAVELVKRKLPKILFPNKIESNDVQIDVNLDLDNGELRTPSSIVPWFNPALNIVQKQAVTNILRGVARPLPYVIFGPPGTGKTVTLIETILQIMKLVPHSRVLVATPSNSSANLITQRIIDSGVLNQGEFIRLVGENSVQKEAIPESIIRYCGTIDIAREGTTKEEIRVTESGLKMNCNAKYLRLRRLLIGTCVTVGTLMQCAFPEDHFTHIIVDESGQCLESQVMIPLSFVDKQIGQIILAGDPMQLGPIVISRFAAERGLDQSYLVRLLERIPYRPDAERFEHRYDPRLVTKLIYNYRSLPSIMSVYSQLFYDDDLKAMVNDSDSKESEILKALAHVLPNQGERDVKQGIIFYGVEGRSESCLDSPSWLNNAEAKHVFQFFIKLIRMGYTADDIGIITPYTQQVRTIRALLEHTDLVMPKIGTVEEFQGQERQIILLSTVRTMRQQLLIDEKHSLGFIKSPKRMNVAISRARALLVVFGSPKLLSRDVNWKFLIRNCIDNKCSVNCDPALVNIQNVDSDDGEDDN